MAELTGRCMCGAIRWSHPGPAIRNLVCHCRDCQRATSAPFTAFIGLAPGALRWTGAPDHYQSSPGTWRGFCRTCGSRLYFRSEKWPAEIHLHAATLDDPELHRPDRHVCVASSPGWLHLADGLPRHDGFHANPAGPEAD